MKLLTLIAFVLVACRGPNTYKGLPSDAVCGFEHDLIQHCVATDRTYLCIRQYGTSESTCAPWTSR